jgi:hypothetical protein
MCDLCNNARTGRTSVFSRRNSNSAAGGGSTTIDMRPGPATGVGTLLKQALRLLVRGQLRVVPQLDTYPRIVAFAETHSGRALLLLMFLLLLVPTNQPWPVVVVAGAAACAYAGPHRRWILVAATLSVLCLRPHWFIQPRLMESNAAVTRVIFDSAGLMMLAAVAAVFVFSLLLIFLARHFRHFSILRRPILLLHILAAFIIVFADLAILPELELALLWAFIIPFCAYFFFLAYALHDQGTKDRWPILAQLGTFHPFWGSTSTPYGKGATYLRKAEAATPQDLAVTQLKGLKLLFWAYVLQAANMIFTRTVHGYLQVPTFHEAFAHLMAHNPYSWYTSWAALISSFFESLLGMAVSGHVIIACARMAGFRLLRNTYKPLSARSVAEFWNRYYYYFKELLVEIYYYPTFLRCFKKYRRIRLLFATFMAAGVGNAFYHFIRDIDYVASEGLIDAIVGYQTYLFYCAMLSAGIGISQLRSPRMRSHKSWFRRAVLAPVSVSVFYIILSIFSDDSRQYSLGQHFSFLFHLFGVNP